jgi:phosphate/sulfate permease
MLLEHVNCTHQDSHIVTVGASVWLILATFLKLPVSTTHSVVGATIGFTVVCRADEGLNWESFGLIGSCSVVC